MHVFPDHGRIRHSNWIALLQDSTEERKLIYHTRHGQTGARISLMRSEGTLRNVYQSDSMIEHEMPANTKDTRCAMRNVTSTANAPLVPDEYRKPCGSERCPDRT